MDILKQYEKQNPEISQIPASQELQEGSFLARMAMRLSGGRIKDAKQANYVLLGVMIFCFVFAIVIYNVMGPGTVPPIKSITTQDVLPK